MIKKLSVYAFALLVATVLFSSCKKDYESVQMVDDGKIADYLAKNNINAIADSAKTGYFYVVNNPAPTTPAPTTPVASTYKTTDSVRYNIVVKSLLNGTVYTSSPLIQNLGVLVGYTGGVAGKSIPAILDVMQKIQPGGSARIFLPSYLAFGKNGTSSGIKVPSNEVLEIVLTTYAEKQPVLDDQHIRDFLTANSLTATKDPGTGVYYTVTEPGTGTDPIGLNTDVSVNYSFRLLDGTLIQESSSATLFTISEVILGWRVLKNFKKGAKVRIFIPSVSGYGNSVFDLSDGKGGVIPANSCLDYTIEIVDVINN